MGRQSASSRWERKRSVYRFPPFIMLLLPPNSTFYHQFHASGVKNVYPQGWIRFFPSSGLNPRFEFVAASRSVVSLAKKRVRIGTYGERPNLAESVYFSRTRKSSYPLEGDVNRVGKPLKPSSKFFSSLSQFFAPHLSRIKKAKEIRRKAPNLPRFKILEYKI